MASIPSYSVGHGSHKGPPYLGGRNRDPHISVMNVSKSHVVGEIRLGPSLEI